MHFELHDLSYIVPIVVVVAFFIALGVLLIQGIFYFFRRIKKKNKNSNQNEEETALSSVSSELDIQEDSIHKISNDFKPTFFKRMLILVWAALQIAIGLTLTIIIPQLASLGAAMAGGNFNSNDLPRFSLLTGSTYLILGVVVLFIYFKKRCSRSIIIMAITAPLAFSIYQIALLSQTSYNQMLFEKNSTERMKNMNTEKPEDLSKYLSQLSEKNDICPPAPNDFKLVQYEENEDTDNGNFTLKMPSIGSKKELAILITRENAIYESGSYFSTDYGDRIMFDVRVARSKNFLWKEHYKKLDRFDIRIVDKDKILNIYTQSTSAKDYEQRMNDAFANANCFTLTLQDFSTLEDGIVITENDHNDNSTATTSNVVYNYRIRHPDSWTAHAVVQQEGSPKPPPGSTVALNDTDSALKFEITVGAYPRIEKGFISAGKSMYKNSIGHGYDNEEVYKEYSGFINSGEFIKENINVNGGIQAIYDIPTIYHCSGIKNNCLQLHTQFNYNGLWYRLNAYDVDENNKLMYLDIFSSFSIKSE